MSKPILLNAFQMNTVVHHGHGMWTHPRDRSRHYNELGYWLDLARTLERGCFDGIFLADVLGVYDVYQGSPDAALRNAMQIPVGDPMLLIPAMAAVTEHLGFGVTGTIGFEPPYPFARRMSTLDHLTNGRIAWNVVTGYLNSAARGIGLSTQQTHDQRYEAADEFMEVVYRLWEGSWEDDAVVADKLAHVFADPAKCTACASTARITASMRSTCASHRRSARQFCFRPVLLSAAVCSLLATPSAFSSSRRRSQRRRPLWPTCVPAQWRRDARPTTCASSTWPP